MARGIRFLTPNLTTDIEDHELEVLRPELEMIADGAPRLAAAAELASRLDELAVQLTPTTTAYEPDDRERFALLRATDHLRNLSHEGELMELRARLLDTGNAKPIGYKLRFLDARPSESFASYSLRYEADDRLVTAIGGVLRVVDANDDELVVDDWRQRE